VDRRWLIRRLAPSWRQQTARCKNKAYKNGTTHNPSSTLIEADQGVPAAKVPMSAVIEPMA
jgi:hypothetical protein